MTLRVVAIGLSVVVAAVACKDSTSPAGTTGRIRIVNSVFQGADVTTAAPASIDVMIDSSTSGAGVAGLAGASLGAGSASGAGAGSHSGTSAIFTSAGYRDLPSALHSFLGRVAGTSGPLSTFFQTNDGPYLPKQYILPFPYTFVLAGVVPDTMPASPDAVPWAMIVDDPFTPPADSARLQLINAAPMADTTGAGGGTTITATFDDGAGGVYTASADYRKSSGYVNPAPGNYTLTLSSGSFVLYTGSVTLAKGEVRSFIVQSTAYADIPGPANTKVTNLLDNQW
ncbi:MAG TPA: hypothetical protein VG454_03885 [Gemmatimonadales bacterium]|nr:hypothetical protein [Gemmatimonadales bacterium]